MGMFYDYHPPHPEEQHNRLVALRLLTDNNIPCILWAEDAMCYVYSVPTYLFDQQILVPDELLESAANILQAGSSRYVPTVHAWDYAEIFGPNKGATPFPKSIRLRHLDIPEDDPYKLEPIPGFIVLHPQSYFGLDVRDQSRFQSLVSPLDPSNAKILVPKYHTFLEGLIHFVMNPPTRLDVPHPHSTSKRKHEIFISYLVHYRVKYDMDVIPPVHDLYPEEAKILSEVQTDEARWYLRQLMWERKNVFIREILDYQRQSATGTLSSSASSVNVTNRFPGASTAPRLSIGADCRTYATDAVTNQNSNATLTRPLPRLSPAPRLSGGTLASTSRLLRRAFP